MAQVTLSRAEFVGLMDTGIVPVIEDDDKPGQAEAEANDAVRAASEAAKAERENNLTEKAEDVHEEA